MKAAFSYAVRYSVTAECLTPLRTADSDGNTETVLLGSDGRCLIQGSSLAGAMRAWAEKHEEKALVSALFGEQSRHGSLIISDGRFSDSASIVIRPRLRINGKTGTAVAGREYDLAHIGTGAAFSFSLCWLGEKSTLRETEAVERILSALHRGEILLGAQKTNGFGRVRLNVIKKAYDMFVPEDRECWLSGVEGGSPLTFPAQEKDRIIVFSLRGQADSVLVKAAAEEHGSEGSTIPNMTEAGVPVIPGSSIKGAVRARAEQIAAFLGIPESFTETLFGREARDGDNGMAGRTRFEDAMIGDGISRKITRIRINRFTGGVVRGGLFKEEPVNGTLSLRIMVPAEDGAGCMLLLYALRDLALGLYSLGSGASIGRGFLRVEELTAETPEGHTVTLRFNDEKECEVSDPDELIPTWRQVLEAIK